MVDTVQSKEDGIVRYIKTHADATDGVRGKLVKAAGNEAVLGIKNFQDGIQIDGKSVSADAKPAHEVVKDYWDGARTYLTGSQSVTISNSGNADGIVLIFSRYNDNSGGITHSIPVIPNITRLKYKLPAAARVSSASADPAITYRKVSISKSGTSLVITGDTTNTLDEANKKVAFREIGVMRCK